MDKIIVLIIFCCDGEPTVPQVHYYHDNSTICARFCYSSGERFRSSCPVPIIIVVLPADLHVLNGFVTVRASCSTPNSSQAWTSASKSDRWLRWFRLQTLTRDFPPKRVDQAAGFSAHLQCRRSRRVRGYRL